MTSRLPLENAENAAPLENPVFCVMNKEVLDTDLGTAMRRQAVMHTDAVEVNGDGAAYHTGEPGLTWPVDLLKRFVPEEALKSLGNEEVPEEPEATRKKPQVEIAYFDPVKASDKFVRAGLDKVYSGEQFIGSDGVRTFDSESSDAIVDCMRLSIHWYQDDLLNTMTVEGELDMTEWEGTELGVCTSFFIYADGETGEDLAIPHSHDVDFIDGYGALDE